jgi:hypothetical protein
MVQKILSVCVDHLIFVDSLNFLPNSLKSMPKSFDLTCKKGYYPHFFNTAKNLDYVGPYPDPKYYEVDYMFREERAQFSERYEEYKDKHLRNKEEL